MDFSIASLYHKRLSAFRLGCRGLMQALPRGSHSTCILSHLAVHSSTPVQHAGFLHPSYIDPSIHPFIPSTCASHSLTAPMSIDTSVSHTSFSSSLHYKSEAQSLDSVPPTPTTSSSVTGSRPQNRAHKDHHRKHHHHRHDHHRKRPGRAIHRPRMWFWCLTFYVVTTLFFCVMAAPDSKIGLIRHKTYVEGKKMARYSTGHFLTILGWSTAVQLWTAIWPS